MNIKTYEFQSEWARNLIAQGEARGKAEGEATAICASSRHEGSP